MRLDLAAGGTAEGSLPIFFYMEDVMVGDSLVLQVQNITGTGNAIIQNANFKVEFQHFND